VHRRHFLMGFTVPRRHRIPHLAPRRSPMTRFLIATVASIGTCLSTSAVTARMRTWRSRRLAIWMNRCGMRRLRMEKAGKDSGIRLHSPDSARTARRQNHRCHFPSRLQPQPQLCRRFGLPGSARTLRGEPCSHNIVRAKQISWPRGKKYNRLGTHGTKAAQHRPRSLSPYGRTHRRTCIWRADCASSARTPSATSRRKLCPRECLYGLWLGPAPEALLHAECVSL